MTDMEESADVSTEAEPSVRVDESSPLTGFSASKAFGCLGFSMFVSWMYLILANGDSLYSEGTQVAISQGVLAFIVSQVSSVSLSRLFPSTSSPLAQGANALRAGA